MKVLTAEEVPEVSDFVIAQQKGDARMTSSTRAPTQCPSRVGVYICHCGTNIAGTVDVEAVTQFATSLPEVVVARHYSYMCSDPGQALIKEDIVMERAKSCHRGLLHPQHARRDLSESLRRGGT